MRLSQNIMFSASRDENKSAVSKLSDRVSGSKAKITTDLRGRNGLVFIGVWPNVFYTHYINLLNMQVAKFRYLHT